VVGVAAIGWMFDTMAQQLFNLARVPALRDLMGARPRRERWRSRPASRPWSS